LNIPRTLVNDVGRIPHSSPALLVEYAADRITLSVPQAELASASRPPTRAGVPAAGGAFQLHLVFNCINGGPQSGAEINDPLTNENL
jgi:hypothetical protein